MKFELGTALCATLLVVTQPALAAGTPRSPILDLGSVGAMRAEVERLYGEAVRTSSLPEVIQADDSRFLWSSEAKVACGIALGYLKTRTVNEENINKCGEFARLMAGETPAVVEATPVPPPPSVECPPLPVVIFFDWNVDAPPSNAGETIGQIAASMGKCGWTGLKLTGKADRSGAEPYNQALSARRARNVASLFEAAGTPAASLAVVAKGETEPAVETVDGVREPMNRRVDIDNAASSN